MDLNMLKKKMDGFRTANGTLRSVPPELLLELRQMWENFPGPVDQFRRELGVKNGTLRKLLADSKKLNHVIAGSGAIGLIAADGMGLSHSTEGSTAVPGPELVYDDGSKVIRFPNVDILLEFLKKAS